MKKISAIIALVFVFVLLFSVPASAKAYQTYTYSLEGFALYSPDAYVPETTVDSVKIGLNGTTAELTQPIKEPCDLEVDSDGNVYIADAGEGIASRIIIMDRYYNVKHIIRNFTNDQGNPDSLAGPQGVFITDDTIFVCDTNKNRIVTFDRYTYEFIDIIKQPESELFEENSVYKPVAIAVDQFNRLYVISSTTFQGVIVMTRDGDFTGFIGAQKSSLSAWDIMWRRFQTEAQREQSQKVVSTEFNNVAITADGFIYATTSSLKEDTQNNAIRSKSKTGDYSPVKMLNAAGEEIMRRNGFWPPNGDVTAAVPMGTAGMQTDRSEKPLGASKIVDVAVGPEKTWSIIDNKRSKVYTYDFDGNLLFVFGDSGQQLGNISGIGAVTYQEDKMLLLDKTNDTFTIYKRTEYGDVLIQALAHQNARQYDIAIDDWTEIQKRNSNYDAAYIGIGQSLYHNGEYEESLKYFKAAYDTTNYDNSYKEIRTQWISKYILLIPVGIAVICIGWVYFMKYCNKVNSRAAVAGGKRNFKEEILYAFYLIFHPFDGFWDLKHEKRGSLRAAIVYILLTVLAFFYQSVGSGYAVNQQVVYRTIVDELISVLVPILLWAIANWCLTTLFDGEGSLKDVIIAMGYSMIPLILTIIPTTIASNFIISSEVGILSLITTIGFVWTGMLIFFGMMITHDYSMFKNILTSLGTLLGMVLIMFIALLFTTLLGKVVSFISNIVTEINYRM